MNHTQLKYATTRIDTLLRTASAKIAPKHTTPGKLRDMSQVERYKLAVSGKVQLKPLTKLERYGSFESHFDFSAYEDKVDRKAVERELGSLEAEAERIKDTLYLGDQAAALRAIEAFAKRCAS